MIGDTTINTFYQSLLKEANHIIDSESDGIAILANVAALLFLELESVNWVGFYLLNTKRNALVLGPFQGKPAVTRIKVGKGLCGRALQEKKPIIVGNVCEFDGHITCDLNSKSECVIPIYGYRGGKKEIKGVLDIDSPVLNRFTNDDLLGLSGITGLIACIDRNYSPPLFEKTQKNT